MKLLPFNNVLIRDINIPRVYGVGIGVGWWIVTSLTNIVVKGGKFLKKLWCCVGGSIAR